MRDKNGYIPAPLIFCMKLRTLLTKYTNPRLKQKVIFVISWRETIILYNLATTSRIFKGVKNGPVFIAVGSNTFTTDILSQLGSRARGRKIIKKGQSFQIREKTEPYNRLFDGEKDNIAPENAPIWQ